MADGFMPRFARGVYGDVWAKARRERLKQARTRGRHTADEWAIMLEVCNHVCLACGHREKIAGPYLTKDHIVPISLGGDDTIANLQPLCLPCNASKGNRSWGDLRPDDWREWTDQA